MNPLKVSVIVTTYNWPQALQLVLESLLSQSVKPYEIVIADDGSTLETQILIKQFQDKNIEVPLIHMYQKDKGFRAAKARNRAVALSSGDYLVFIDGDCIVPYDFIENHTKLAQKNWFVSANRLLLSESFTKDCLSQTQWQDIRRTSLSHLDFLGFCKLYWHKKVNKVTPLIKLPLGPLRKCFPQKWEGVKTCNLGVFRTDFVKVNGFNEAFEGWGYEDTDLVIRLFRIGVYRKEGRFKVPVFHLWHKENDKSAEKDNLARLEKSRLDAIFVEHGLDQHFQTEGFSHD